MSINPRPTHSPVMEKKKRVAVTTGIIIATISVLLITLFRHLPDFTVDPVYSVCLVQFWSI